ncbi:hypothetical protein Tco_0324112 [Tanacetum coccineum]
MQNSYRIYRRFVIALDDMWEKSSTVYDGELYKNKLIEKLVFTQNEFVKFVAEPGETLVSVYNRFAQLMNDLERNDMHFPIWKRTYHARNCPKPRVRDLKYFMEQMLLAKQDEAVVILTDEQNDFLFADASRMEEIEELSANICLMARIQPTVTLLMLDQSMIMHL